MCGENANEYSNNRSCDRAEGVDWLRLEDKCDASVDHLL